MEADRISNLPSEILEQILTCLPIKEAVRTSVLSSQWRYRASRLRDLVFDSCDLSSRRDRSTILAGIIDHVLLVHNGPIHKFQLNGVDACTDRDLDRWILHLSQNSIKEFILNQYKTGVPHKLPSCLFSCQELTNLELWSCVLKVPSSFKGFKSLKRIDFMEVTMAQDVFDNLIGCCPLLESLSLVHCEGLMDLNIDAPNLQSLAFAGCFKDISLLNATNLVDVSITVDDDKYCDYHRRVSGPCSNLVKILSYLPDHVERLDFYGLSLMYLAIGALPGELPKPYSHLTYLRLSISLTNLDQSLTALYLLRSCPVLQELDIQVNPWDAGVIRKGNSWFDNDRRCSFSQLRHVDINDLRDIKGDLHFVRYLLMNSPVLERMTIHPHPDVDVSKLEKKFPRFRRASANAKIIYPDPCSEINFSW